MSLSAEPSADIRIGTSGYDYPEWEGVLYSKGIGRKEYLGAYSEAFGTVELNFSSYRTPKSGDIRELLSGARRPMDFAIKANRALTEKADPATWKDCAAALAKGVGPLGEAGSLCAVLLEFPFSFRYREDERRYLDRLLKALAAFPLVVEFRSSEWFNARVIDALKERRVGLCSVDVPRLEGLPPLSDLVTSDIAYVRFHGRNEAAWRDGDEGTSHEYLYSKDELGAWVPRLEAMSTRAKKLRAFFNNRRRGDAAVNAKELAALARAAKLI